MKPAGRDVNLTCTVDLSFTVDVPVTVSTVWTGPNEFTTTSTAQSVTGSITAYATTIATIRFFGRNHSGIYTCAATLSSSSPFLPESSTVSEEIVVTSGMTKE